MKHAAFSRLTLSSNIYGSKPNPPDKEPPKKQKTGFIQSTSDEACALLSFIICYPLFPDSYRAT